MRFPLATKSDHDSDNIAAHSERLINVYAEPKGSAYALKSVLGTTSLANISSVFLRELQSVNDTLYAVTGGELFSFDTAYVETSLGSVVNSSETSMSSNYTDVCVTAGGSYYVWDGTTLSNPAAGQFSSFGSVTFLGGRTLLTEKDGAQFCWSDVADATTLPGVNFATAQSRDDDILRGIAFGGNYWIFGERSIELWSPTQLAGANAFTPINGALIETGLKAYNLVTQFPNGLFFVGNDGIVYVVSGEGLRPISTPAVETAISQGEATSCFYYEDEGHKFCVVRFRDRPSWAYDISTGLWHERADGPSDAWTAVISTKHAGAWLIGTNDGQVSRLGRVNVDVSGPLIRTVITPTMANDGLRFNVAEFEVGARTGFTEATPVMLRTSRDGGVTWGAERQLSVGSVGDYDIRLNARRLGRYRRFTAKITWAGAFDVSLDSVARLRAA